MLSTKEFGEFAKEIVLFAHITSYVEGEPDPDLLSRKGGSGFPYVVAMNADGDVTARLEGNRSVSAFRDLIEAGRKYESQVVADLSASEWAARIEFDLQVGNLTLEEGRKALAEREGVDEATASRIEGALLSLEVRDLMPKDPRDAGERQAAGKAFAGIWKSGRVPSDDQMQQAFFVLMLDHAEAVKDPDLFQKIMTEIRNRWGERAQRFLDSLEDRLSKLKAGPSGTEEDAGTEEPDGDAGKDE